MTFKITLYNTKVIPYNLYNDVVQLEVGVLSNNSRCYLPNLSGNVYSNMVSSGVFTNIGSCFTDNSGKILYQYDTNSISNKTINTSLFYVSFNIDGDEYRSNLCRCNFVSRLPFEGVYCGE